MASTTTTSTTTAAAASAPGKLILFGEHAVVYGEPAIAASLSDLRTKVHVTRRSDGRCVVDLPDLKPHPVHLDANDCTRLKMKAETGDAFDTSRVATEAEGLLRHIWEPRSNASEDDRSLGVSALTPLIYLMNELTPFCLALDGGGISIVVRSSSLPVGAGLGSSAAFSVASVAALFRLRKLVEETADKDKTEFPAKPSSVELEKINFYAYHCEQLIHGTPSGIDNTVATFGGAICYTKKPEGVSMEHLPSLPPLNIVLTNTGVPRSTKVLVSNVREFFQQYPKVVAPIFQAIGEIARHFRKLLEAEPGTEWDSAKHQQVSDLIRTNQLLLQSLGVSHATINEICRVSDNFVGVSSKLTGAGGGGCTMTLSREEGQLQKITEAIREYSDSFECFTSSVGGSGVLWIEPKDVTSS